MTTDSARSGLLPSRGQSADKKFSFAYTPPATPGVTMVPQVETIVPISAEEIATKAMMEIDRYIKLRGAKLMDLLRSTSQEQTDNLHLTRAEFAAVLQKTDLRISAGDLEILFDYIDENGNGELDVKELADAIRDAKKKVRNTPQDAVSRVLANNANYSELELKMLRRHYIPQLIRNRYYTPQRKGGQKKKMTARPSPTSSLHSPGQDKKLWGIWAWNQAYV
jgi:hypothetical protein